MRNDEPRFDDEDFDRAPESGDGRTLLIILLVVGGGLFFICAGALTLGFFAYGEAKQAAMRMPAARAVNGNQVPINQLPGQPFANPTPTYGTMLGTGEYEVALQEVYAALEAQPDSHFLHNNKAWLLATCPVAEIRSGQQALVHAKKACELTEFQNYMYVDTLAAAYAETGDFEQAVMYQQTAVELTQANTPGRDSIIQRVALFESKRAFREGVIPTTYTPPENNDQPNLPETKDKGKTVAETEATNGADSEKPDGTKVESADSTELAPDKQQSNDSDSNSDVE